MKRTSERFEKAKKRYKKNFDARLRKQADATNFDDYVYIRVEQKDPNKTPHKLTTVAQRPYKVMKTRKTCVTEKTDCSFEKVSNCRVVLEPKPESKEDLEEILKPVSATDKHTEYSTKEDINLEDFNDGEIKEDETNESCHMET